MSEPPALRLWSCGRTTTGRVRRNNEDNLWIGRVGDPEARAGDRETSGTSAFPGMLLAVADGMGGAKPGEVASRLAVETLAEEMGRRSLGRGSTSKELQDVGCAAVHAANVRIREDGAKNEAREGMGTTLTVGWVVGGHVELFQVGDSRAYLFREGRLSQLTRDQSLVRKLVEDGILSEEEAERLPGRHIILQALGSEEDLDIVHESVSVRNGDLLLLCTDGLSGQLRSADMEAVLRKAGPLADQCARLIDMAEHQGGDDNITVVLARVG